MKGESSKRILFVCFSHTLTADQKEGWDEIIELKDCGQEGAELANYAKNVPADAESQEVRNFAIEIVMTAIKNRATHFYCTGESCLMINANSLASNTMTCVSSTTARVQEEKTNENGEVIKTSVFKHVQWREVF